MAKWNGDTVFGLWLISIAGYSQILVEGPMSIGKLCCVPARDPAKLRAWAWINGKKTGMYIILIDSLIITCIYSKLPNRIPMPILRNIPC